MSSTSLTERLSIGRLIAVPAIISLAVTLLRLAGELNHWSPRWFSTDTGGILPYGMSWLIGITWLAIPFGIFFALKLRAAGSCPVSSGKSVLLGLAGVLIVLAGSFYRPPISFPTVLIYIWLVMSLAALIQYSGWPDLFKVTLAYGFAARIPVVIVMFLALRGHWGTHYDYTGMPARFQMPFWPEFFWLAFFPQLVFWVAFTILVGTFSGSLASLFKGRPKAVTN